MVITNNQNTSNMADPPTGDVVNSIEYEQAKQQSKDTGIAFEICLKGIIDSAKKKMAEQMVMEENKPVEPPVVRRSSRQRKSTRALNYPNPKRKKLGIVLIDDVQINDVTDGELIRDRILHHVDVDKYHDFTAKNELDSCILSMAKITPREMIDTFTYQSKAYLVTSWLTTVRLFEYNSETSSYFEIKRLPERYIELGPKLITSVHYDESRVYYSYLIEASEHNPSTKRGCVEIRNLKGEPWGDPFTYEYPIKSIQSDRDYVYIKTIKNIVYIHRKDFFHFVSYRVNLEMLTTEPLISVSSSIELSRPIMSTYMIIATPSELLVTRYTIFENKLWQSYQFEQSFTTVSMITRCRGKQLILHRNVVKPQDHVKIGSKIEFGRLERLKGKDNAGKYFIHEKTVCFYYNIIQIEKGPADEELYVFGYNDVDGKIQYELGIYDLKNCKPIWVRRVDGVDINSKILPQPDHFVIIKDCQQIMTVSRVLPDDKVNTCPDCGVSMLLEDFDDHDKHPGIFRHLNTLTNKHLVD